MVVVVPPLRSVFHILCNVPALSELSATRTFATLSRVAPRNPYFDYPTSTPKGCPSVRCHTFTSVHEVISLLLSLLEPVGYPKMLAIQTVPAVPTSSGPFG